MTYPFIFENISTMSYVFLHLQYYFMLLDYDSLTYRVCYFSLILQGLLQIQQGSNVIFEFLSYIHEENGWCFL
jgi:hydrogenase-4 membrane subunit HyfE